MGKLFDYVSILVCLIVFAAAGMSQEVPGMMNYQGKLTDLDGKPVPDGVYSITFRIYGEEDAEVEDALWSETQSVNVKGGLFNVLLGSVNPITADVFAEPNRWLGVQVGDDTEMIPRQRIATVGYAFKAERANVLDADTLDGVDSAQFMRADQDTGTSGNLTVDGNVGIGTTQPGKKLHIHASPNLDAKSSEGKVQIESPSWWNGQLRIKNNNLDDPNGCDEASIGFISERYNRFWVIGPGAGTGVVSDKFGIAYGEGNPDTTGAYPAYVTVTNTGNVGIGTTEPTQELHVNAMDQNADLRLTTGTAEFWDIAKRSDDHSLRFANGMDRLTITTIGNVGIGTTEPTEKLEVKGKIKSSEDIRAGGNYASYHNRNGGIRTWILTTPDWGFYRSLEYGSWLKIHANVKIVPTSGDPPGGVGTPASGALIVSGKAVFSTNVGIGTTEPKYKLDVEGYVQAHGFHTGDITFQKDGQKLWRMFEDENGLYLESLKTGKVYRFVLEEVEK